MDTGPTDNDAILRAGRWATGSPAASAPAPEPDPEAPDLEPIALDDIAPPDAPLREPNPIDPARARRARTIALATTLAVLAGVAGFVTTMFVLDERDTPVADAISDGRTLDGLIVQQSDLGFDDEVVPLPDGSDAVNAATLDLCNGEYATEGSRIARRQVAVLGPEGPANLSTEAVTYRDGGTSEQAFEEVKRVVGSCPKVPVPNAAGTTSYTTLFDAPPDTGWQNTPGVDRLAYDIDQIYEDGTRNRSIVVYLRRGRALMGLYFPAPGEQPTVQGQTEIEDIVNVFATRLAKLPRSAVADPPD